MSAPHGSSLLHNVVATAANTVDAGGGVWWHGVLGLVCAGALVGLGLVAGPATFTMIMLLWSLLSLAVAVSAEAGTTLGWVVPALAIAAGVFNIMMYRRAIGIERGAVAVGGLALIGWGLLLRGQLTNVALNNALPHGLVRGIIGGAPLIGLAALLWSLRELKQAASTAAAAQHNSADGNSR